MRVLLKNTEIYILCISESYLDNTIHNTEINVDGYTLVRKDRNRNGGGVLIYIKENINYKDRADLSDDDVESRWIEINGVMNSPLIIGCYYRPPSAGTQYYDCMINNIERVCAENKEVIILGDFNYDYVLDETLHKKTHKIH
jgi:exonuclease III